MNKTFKIALSFAIFSAFTFSCSSDIEDSFTTKESKMLELQAKVSKIGEEFGLQNLTIDKNSDRLLKMSDEELEQDVREFVSVLGDYTLKRNSQGILISIPNAMPSTRAANNTYAETFSGGFSSTYYWGYNYVEVSVYGSYSEKEGKGKVSISLTDGDTSKWSVSLNSYQFTGNIGSYTFYATLRRKGYTSTVSIYGDYSSASGHGSMTFN